MFLSRDISTFNPTINRYNHNAVLEHRLMKSEAERKSLEDRFQYLSHASKETEENRIKQLKGKYMKFLSDCKERNTRNNEILKSLQKLENGASAVFAKTERLKQLRNHFDTYLSRAVPLWRHPDGLDVGASYSCSLGTWSKDPPSSHLHRPALLLPGGGAVLLPTPVNYTQQYGQERASSGQKGIASLGEAGLRMMRELSIVEGTDYPLISSSKPIYGTCQHDLPIYIPPSCPHFPNLDSQFPLRMGATELPKKTTVGPLPKKSEMAVAKDHVEIECLEAEENACIESGENNLSDDEMDTVMNRSYSFENQPLPLDKKGQPPSSAPVQQRARGNPVKDVRTAHQDSITQLKAMLGDEESKQSPDCGTSNQLPSRPDEYFDEDVPEDFTEQNFPENRHDPRYLRDVSKNVILEEDEEEEEEHYRSKSGQLGQNSPLQKQQSRIVTSYSGKASSQNAAINYNDQRQQEANIQSSNSLRQIQPTLSQYQSRAENLTGARPELINSNSFTAAYNENARTVNQPITKYDNRGLEVDQARRNRNQMNPGSQSSQSEFGVKRFSEHAVEEPTTLLTSTSVAGLHDPPNKVELYRQTKPNQMNEHPNEFHTTGLPREEFEKDKEDSKYYDFRSSEELSPLPAPNHGQVALNAQQENRSAAQIEHDRRISPSQQLQYEGGNAHQQNIPSHLPEYDTEIQDHGIAQSGYADQRVEYENRSPSYFQDNRFSAQQNYDNGMQGRQPEYHSGSQDHLQDYEENKRGYRQGYDERVASHEHEYESRNLDPPQEYDPNTVMHQKDYDNGVPSHQQDYGTVNDQLGNDSSVLNHEPSYERSPDHLRNLESTGYEQENAPGSPSHFQEYDSMHQPGYDNRNPSELQFEITDHPEYEHRSPDYLRVNPENQAEHYGNPSDFQAYDNTNLSHQTGNTESHIRNSQEHDNISPGLRQEYDNGNYSHQQGHSDSVFPQEHDYHGGSGDSEEFNPGPVVQTRSGNEEWGNQYANVSSTQDQPPSRVHIVGKSPKHMPGNQSGIIPDSVEKVGGMPPAVPKSSVLNQLMDSESESYQLDPVGSQPDDSDFDISISKH